MPVQPYRRHSETTTIAAAATRNGTPKANQEKEKVKKRASLSNWEPLSPRIPKSLQNVFLASARGASLGAQIWQVLLTAILKVGQQSLAVFVFSMVLARLIGVFFDVMGRDAWVMWVGNLTGMLLLVAVAYTAGWFKSQPWRKKPAAA